jgi:hypothetical protein
VNITIKSASPEYWCSRWKSDDSVMAVPGQSRFSTFYPAFVPDYLFCIQYLKYGIYICRQIGKEDEI